MAVHKKSPRCSCRSTGKVSFEISTQSLVVVQTQSGDGILNPKIEGQLPALSSLKNDGLRLLKFFTVDVRLSTNFKCVVRARLEVL